MIASLFLLLLGVCDGFSSLSMNLLPQPKGSAATPLQKKKVGVIGGGGYMGGITYGFLQRAASLYGTGIDRNCRVIGSTSFTAVTLNSWLGRHFILAQADETYIKLTNMMNVDSIVDRLQYLDAAIIGLDIVAEKRPVTGGTYETGPNSKTYEIYWDYRRASQTKPDIDTVPAIEQILDNTFEACQKANLKHIVVVGSQDPEQEQAVQKRLDQLTIPYTYIRYVGDLETCPSYTYREGVQGNLQIVSLDNKEKNSSEAATTSSTKNDDLFIFREDLAALCVQCLQSLDWEKSYNLLVTCDGRKAVVTNPTGKRADQEWCVNSIVLEEYLSKFYS